MSISKASAGPEGGTPSASLQTTESLESLQSSEQRNVLNIVDQLRQHGLESTLSLPQLVVCGDQSAGKSSVLEALTEIPFPRNDNLCTRFATEIILRRATGDAITIKVIPDEDRPPRERIDIESFQESISNFDGLPSLIDKATKLMGIDDKSSAKSRAFAKDVLSIEIAGPTRPQLTLVDLPGLVQTETKGVTEADIQLVTEITDRYISQHRTICLAVVAATNDYANQGILKKVRKVDPQGDRTLGIITKPDMLPPGSGSEASFIGLSRNEDIFFKLGWHVVKNRAFEEGSSSFEQRNISELKYFQKSKFSALPQDCVGVASLRERLSLLLFNHVKQELPTLRNDLEEALTDSQRLLDTIGDRRTTAQECKAFLTRLSLDFYEIGKAAVNGHYEGEYFNYNTSQSFHVKSSMTIRRLRAVIRYQNSQFSDFVRVHGHKYHIDDCDEVDAGSDPEIVREVEAETRSDGGTDGTDTGSLRSLSTAAPSVNEGDLARPIHLSRQEALEWVRKALFWTRGRELPGNFNPLLVGELFWEQSSKWQEMATKHMEEVSDVCHRFLDGLLREKCPKDVYTRLWSAKIEDTLKVRFDASAGEMKKIMEDIRSYPITCNHYYTDTIQKRRRKRDEKSLATCIDNATEHVKLPGCNSSHFSAKVDAGKAARGYTENVNTDMENHTCEEALDCLYSIYKVSSIVRHSR